MVDVLSTHAALREGAIESGHDPYEGKRNSNPAGMDTEDEQLPKVLTEPSHTSASLLVETLIYDGRIMKPRKRRKYPSHFIIMPRHVIITPLKVSIGTNSELSNKSVATDCDVPAHCDT
jgi:hypothetical protein